MTAPPYVVAANRYRRAQSRSEDLRAAYLASLVAARAEGISVATLARDLGVHRSRVYKLMEGME